MPILNLRPREECAFDHVSLGEVMLRLDPGDMRVKTAREFRAWEGGGEYNVARGLRRCFGLAPPSSPPWPTTRSAAWSRISCCRAASTCLWSAGYPYDGLGRTCATA